MFDLKKISILLSFFIVLKGIPEVFAQDFPYEDQVHSFVNYNKNVLDFPKDSSKMEKFFDRLDTLIYFGKGKINIVHIGGSHVQADIISGQMRQRLQTFFPGNKGSRGLTFPYAVAKTNNPYDFKVNYTGAWSSCKNTQSKEACLLGLTGMRITTLDTNASIKVKLNNPNNFLPESYKNQYRFNSVKIYTTPNDSTQLDIFIKELEHKTHNKTVNLEKGIISFSFSEYLDSATFVFKQTDSTQISGFTIFGIQYDQDRAGITYHSIGVNGAATTSYLRCALFEQHLKEIKPDLMILGIGINDAAGSGFDPLFFERNYSRIVEMIYAANPNCAIIFISNNDSYKYYRRRYYVNKNGAIVRKCMYNLAAKYNQAVWDLYTIMGGETSMSEWEKNGMAKKDKIHFTPQGYRLLGNLMFNALLKSYENHIEETFKKK